MLNATFGIAVVVVVVFAIASDTLRTACVSNACGMRSYDRTQRIIRVIVAVIKSGQQRRIVLQANSLTDDVFCLCSYDFYGLRLHQMTI